MTKRSIRSVGAEELAAWLQEKGQPLYRAKQIREWLDSKLAMSFDEMKNIPKALRELLDEEFAVSSLTVAEEFRSNDKTVKWVSSLRDGAKIETVLIHAPSRCTVCVSTQVGCAVRCAFCVSGHHGLVRNLSTDEIVDQVLLASHEAGKFVDNIVVMGSGEPMHNLDNLIPALERICDQENGFGLGARHITISTSGIPNGIRRLAALQRPWNLAVSLHAPDDRTRAMIIPDRCRYPISEIMDACEYYRESTGRMITFEYVLVDGVNASLSDARKLARIARNARAKVNLIPLNHGAAQWKAPSQDDCRKFLDMLESSGVQATIRLRKGDKIRAACGQLAAKKGDNGKKLIP
ncbi:MAG: 23S rRNA (adenine(2503)-C(2))-methyltransferase RlmN [Victivallales bacterium]|nr:23S rRNA (adenine(2503)-C(2))-methyltransferase RlmN [Victivallales bacterium]